MVTDKIGIAVRKKVAHHLRLLGTTVSLLSFFIGLFFSHALLAVEPLSVEGNQVLIGGRPGSLAGNSFFWTNQGWGGEKFYNEGVVAWLKNDWNSQVIRAAMGVEETGGYLALPGSNRWHLTQAVEAALAHDMYVIIDWHSHKAEYHQEEAIAFFRDMAKTYGHHNNIIYEIYNEPPGEVSWPDIVKPYSEAVIQAIREHDPDNLIIVGTPRWSQDVHLASRDPITGFKNIAYSLHFYAASHKQETRDKAQEALDNGIPLFVTEWGTVTFTSNGIIDVEEIDRWMRFLRDNNISHANWAVNDKDEDTSILKPGGNPHSLSEASLTESGLLVRDLIRHWDGIPEDPENRACTVKALPVQIEAEDYCTMQGIQTESTSDVNGGRNVGYIDDGDWISYTINVQEAGDYRFSYRVASLANGGLIQVMDADAQLLGEIDLPITEGWQNWETVSHTISLPAGTQTLTFSAEIGGYNLNWLDIRADEASTCAINSLPARIEAENYCEFSGVLTEPTTDVGGGVNIGYIDAGDWVSYRINVARAGEYTLRYRVASLAGGGALRLSDQKGQNIGTIAVPKTGDWQAWTTIEQTVALTPEQTSLVFHVPQGGFNINWIDIQ